MNNEQDLNNRIKDCDPASAEDQETNADPEICDTSDAEKIELCESSDENLNEISIGDSDEISGENSGEELRKSVPENEKSKPHRILSFIYDYVEIFAASVIAVLIIFTFCFRLCRVDGNSMNKTLSNGEMLITSSLFYTPSQGDIVVFHLSNRYYEKPLVKRVIATEGQTVEINFTDRVITVNGVMYEDEYAYIDGGSYELRSEFNERYIFIQDGKIYFRAEVPEGKLFVLGDNRNHSSDSRAKHIGFIDEDCVLGKAVIRISPFGFID